MPEISIGQIVDIVIEHGIIRSSSVQDIQDNRIVFLQITPPLPDEYVNKIILITYLLRGDRHVRRGFQAKVTEIREGYVTVGRGFPVIIAEPLAASTPCDLRAYERHAPLKELKICFGTEEMEIIDISSGGAHLVHHTGIKHLFAAGNTISLTFYDGNRQFERPARIVRLWHSKGSDGPEHLAVSFISK